MAKLLSNKENAKAFTAWASKYGTKLSAKALQKGAENLSVVLDVVSAAENALLIGAFIYDLFFSESNITVFVNKKDGVAQISTSLPPNILTVTGTFTGTAGNAYNYNATSLDPDGDKVKYIIYYGDGTRDESNYLNSGQNYVFTHIWQAGNYEIYT